MYEKNLNEICELNQGPVVTHTKLNQNQKKQIYKIPLPTDPEEQEYIKYLE